MSARPDTASLLGEVSDFVRRYVVLQGDHFYDAIALWILHAHAIRAFETSPRLLVKSPEKESGKTRLLEVLEVLVPNPLFVVNTTISVIFRLLATKQLTLLHDEVDAVFSVKAAPQNEDLRAILNSGYRRGAVVARAEREGKHAVREFPVFAATALAAIGNLPETIESRSIKIPMRRRSPDEEVTPFRRRKVEGEAHELRDAIAEWAEGFIDSLSESEPEMPEGIEDRAADIWEPLVAIADLAGADWPERARKAAVLVVAGRLDEDLSVGVRLLVDVRTVMAGLDRISSAGLAAKLNELEESGWGAWHDGKGLNQRDLAGRLRAYGITPKDIRMPDGSVPKGYSREVFQDAFARYLRDGASATSATKRYTDSYSKDGFVADVAEERGGERRDAPQQSLPFVPETSATSATPYSKPVALRSGNGSGPLLDDPLEDEDYLAAVVDEADVDAVREEEAAEV
jgi:hypothetical protein